MSTQRLNYSAITMLSDDDLAIIFLYFPVPMMTIRSVSSDSTPDFTPREQDANPRDRSWLHISHVCRRWRAISLSCSTIWSTINITSLRSLLVLASLYRAKRAHLTTIIDWTSPYRRSDLELLQELVVEALFHLPHTSHLAIRGELPCGTYERIIPTMQALEVDTLETIQLSTKAYIEDVDLPSTSVALPSALFLRPPSRLRKLALHGAFSLKRDSMLFVGGLTHLSLSHITPVSIPSIDMLLDLLGRCPLEVMSLVASLPAMAHRLFDLEGADGRLPTLSGDYTKLHMPRLMHCNLEDHGLQVADFIRRIEVPLTCQVSLYLGRQNAGVDASGITPTPLSSILQTLREFCLPRSSLYKASLHFEQRRGSRAHWNFAGRVSDAPDAPLSTIELSMGGTADPDTVHIPIDDVPPGTFLSGVFIATSSIFPLQTVRSAHISVRSMTCRLFWDVMLDLVVLESITVAGPSVRGFAEALDQYAQFPQTLAQLKEVILAHAEMAFPFVEVDCLESALRRRMLGGLRPLMLTLDQCEIPQGVLEKLEAVAGQHVQCVGEPDIWKLDALSSDEEEDDSDWDSESESDEFPYNAIDESEPESDDELGSQQ